MLRARIAWLAALLASLGVGIALPLEAHATPYRLTATDRTEITQLLQRFFEATRDGDVPNATTALASRAEIVRIYQPGTEPFIERQLLAMERDVRELRIRFANGTWVGVSATFAQTPSIEIGPCGRFGTTASQCTEGPVIDWRVGDAVNHLRIDRLVRLNGHWKIFDPRL